ncbi:TNT domain-containing protein [Cryobacterium suzukii]
MIARRPGAGAGGVCVVGGGIRLDVEYSFAALQRDYGTTVDRIGPDSGRYLGLRVDRIFAPFEARSLPISSLGEPLNAYDLTGSLPPGWKVEVSEIAPGFGRTGGGIQVQFLDSEGVPVRVKELIGVVLK